MRDGGREPQQQRKFFPRRAVMYVPASDERKTKKATTLSVDTLVFDLEDGVAANQKVALVYYSMAWFLLRAVAWWHLV